MDLTELRLLHHMDNSDSDASGFGNDMVRTGATFDNTTKKVGTHSLNCDGIDDEANCGNDSSLDVADYTLAFWVYYTSAPKLEYLAGRWDDGANNGFVIRKESTGQIGMRHKSTGGVNIITSAGSYTGSGWVSIILTFAAGVGSELFVQNVSQGTSSTTTVAVPSYSQDFIIGANDYAPAKRYATVKIDELALFGRVWTAGERAEFQTGAAIGAAFPNKHNLANKFLLNFRDPSNIKNNLAL